MTYFIFYRKGTTMQMIAYPRKHPEQTYNFFAPHF